MEKYTYVTLRQKPQFTFELRLLILIKLFSSMVLLMYHFIGTFFNVTYKNINYVKLPTLSEAPGQVSHPFIGFNGIAFLIFVA